jgi:hypothetical protein
MVNYFVLYKQDVLDIPTDQGANFVSAIAGFVAGAVVTVAVSLFTVPKPGEDLQGLVYGPLPQSRLRSTGDPHARHGGAAGGGRRRAVPPAGAARLGRGGVGRRLLHPDKAEGVDIDLWTGLGMGS